MKFLKSQTAAYLTDLICCALLGASVCTALLPCAGIETSFGGCLLLMAVDLGLVVLFAHKWWLLPVCFACVAAVGLLTVTILGVSNEVWEYIGGFFRWCAASYPETLPYSANGSILLVQLVFTLPLAIISYLYYRRLFFFPILPAAAFALLLWIYVSDYDSFWPVFAMLLTVVFLSIAKMTGYRINRSLPEKDRISSALLVMTSMVLVPVIVLFSFILSPKNDGDWQYKALYDSVQDLSDYLGWGEGSGPVQGTFGLGISGFSPLESRLGGDVLPDNTRVMSVITDTPVHLKGAVYDSYDGKRWYDSGKLHRYRFIGALWQDMRDEILGLKKPDGSSSAQELFLELTRPAEFSISYFQRGNTLFIAGHVMSLDSNSLDVTDVFFNNQAELFTSKPLKSLRYTLHTVIFDRDNADFDANMLALETLTENADDAVYDGITAEYLKLPDSLPDSVRKKAAEITQNSVSAYQKAKAIEDWLSQNCTYNLTPGVPPEGQDFVEHFLEKREGYCVYFASAMTVLARSEGLPARFVAGYAIKRDPVSKDKNAYVATNAMAHAWTEVYFKGIGWVAFDATGWNSSENALIGQSNISGLSAPVPTATPTPPPDIAASSGAAKGSKMPEEIKALLIMLICIIIALALFMAVRFILLLTGARGFYRRLCRRYGNICDSVNFCYSRIVRQAVFLDIRQDAADTITSFARRVDNRLESTEMTCVCECVIRMRFRLEEPTHKELKDMCEFSAELEKRLRVSLGISGYIWRRLLIGR